MSISRRQRLAMAADVRHRLTLTIVGGSHIDVAGAVFAGGNEIVELGCNDEDLIVAADLDACI